jgi:hypothetical protein
MQPPKPQLPDFTAEGATQQDVIHCPSFLVTEDIDIGVLQTVSKGSVICPTSTMHDQPEEESYPRRCWRLSDELGAKRGHWP